MSRDDKPTDDRPTSSQYAREHAERARHWTPPKQGGYSAVVPVGRSVRTNPPKGKGAVSPAKRSA